MDGGSVGNARRERERMTWSWTSGESVVLSLGPAITSDLTITSDPQLLHFTF